MFENKIVQENCKKLRGHGFKFIEPTLGKLACGVTGLGHLAEVDEIVKAVEKIWRLWRGSQVAPTDVKVAFKEVGVPTETVGIRQIFSRRGSQVVRQWSAKPLFSGSIPLHASNFVVNGKWRTVVSNIYNYFENKSGP